MEIDTLILGGGALKCISFLGILEYLMLENIIHEDLREIKTIYSLSGGTIFIFPLLIGYSMDEYKEILLNSNFSKGTDPSLFSLNNIIQDYGLFENKFMKFYIQKFLVYKGYSKNLTLDELYKIKAIELNIQVFNLSKNKEETVNYKNQPNIPLWKICMMTSCVPIIFKPIIYKGCLYTDGGINKNYPNVRTSKSEKYIACYCTNDIDVHKVNEKIVYDNIIEYIFHIFFYSNDSINNSENRQIQPTYRNIEIQISSKDGYNFNASPIELSKIYRYGFIRAGQHFSRFKDKLIK